MSHKPPLIGIVLAGGKSSRMGSDKSMISYHGRPQYQYVFDLLSLCCCKAFLSVKEYTYLLNFPQLKDGYAFGGPLNGILTALSYFPGYSVLAVACDMPGINLKMIDTLINNHKLQLSASCFKVNNDPEPLLSLWSPQSYQPLMDQAKEANYSPKFFLKNNPANFISLDNIEGLININTPEENLHFKQKINKI